MSLPNQVDEGAGRHNFMIEITQKLTLKNTQKRNLQFDEKDR